MNKTMAFLGTLVTATLLGATAALAAEPTPAEQVGDMASTAAGQLTPIVLAVGGALVAVAVVRFGVRWVLGAISNGGRG